MHPPIFRSRKHYANYIKCVNSVEVGDLVECLYEPRYGSFLNQFANRIIFPLDNSDELRVILPIIGKSVVAEYTQGEMLYASLVDLNNCAIISCGYDIDNIYQPNRFSVGKSARIIYSNTNLDIVYSRIIKRKK